MRKDGERLLVARGGRGGRGNQAFKTATKTAPRLMERGEPGALRWLGVELRLLADVGFLGVPNAGKSTLLAGCSAARPKIANYPFTTIVPNLGVCDIGDEGAGLVLCDIPGLIEGASEGTGLGFAFLRHVQRCKVLLHVVDGTSEDPVGDFLTINKELANYDEFLAQKPQVVVLNKMDVPEARDRSPEILARLKQAAGHSRVLPISAATTERCKELMGRLKKFVVSQPDVDLPPPAQITFDTTDLEFDADNFELECDPAFPGQWRVNGNYIEGVARMTHWEYPEAVERFGRILEATGIAAALEERGAVDGDLVMIDKYDFDFSPGRTNVYIPKELLDRDAEHLLYATPEQEEELEKLQKERAIMYDLSDNYNADEYFDGDEEEMMSFNEDGDWDLLMAEDEGEDYAEEIAWTSS
uniref:OBG-type G domain-containing protein n=1 Tax=Corethron hystrix TaxID=216773 RepID=A0A7S1FY25_9STRA